MLIVTMNPWQGIVRSFDSGLIDRAGMDIVVELTEAVVADAPCIDQRSIADRDHFEECGEASTQCATAAVGRGHQAIEVVDFLRAKYGEAGVQHGTDMWELCDFLQSRGVPHVTHQQPVGQAFAACLARNHVAIGALWTEYNGARELVPVPGGHIGHWECGGALRSQQPAPALPVYPPETIVGAEEAMTKTPIAIQTDAGGNGFAHTAIAWDHFVGVTHNGSDPEVDNAYWPGSVHAQNRGGTVLLTITGARANTAELLLVSATS
jgi:hypothetical protein